jgi:hypothetical protein
MVPAEPDRAGGTAAPPLLADYKTNLNAELSAIDVRTLVVHAGAGTLTIIGEPSLRRVVASAHVNARAHDWEECQRIAKEVKLEFSAGGAQNPVLTVHVPRLAGEQSYVADLTVRMPAGVRLTVVDGAGDVEMSGLFEGADITSESGKVHVHEVQGGVTLRTGGAQSIIEECTGLIRVADGHGDLIVQHITGEVQVTDTSGELTVQAVTGNVTASNNPGHPRFLSIEGDLVLQNISPNDAVVRDVSGSITYPVVAKP